MSGIAGMGTTFNLPNYTGELFSLTPSETPLLSAIGGLTGGGEVMSTNFEWQTEDMADPGQDVQVEGATAPTAENRARANVTNVVQIHQKKVSVSYTRQAAWNQLASPSSAPYNRPGGDNPVKNEMDKQISMSMAKIALDVNWSFINGVYANPANNATPRKTRGLLAAIVSNVVDLSSSTIGGLTSATDTITETATALANGDIIFFSNTDVATGIVAGRKYYVVSKSTNAFKVSKTLGGTAITLGTAANLAYRKQSATALSVDNVNALAQLAYDNGGISNQQTATLLVNSGAKLAISAAYANSYGKTQSVVQGNVGGVVVDRISTDFGAFNIMLDRHVPQDTALVLSLEQLTPCFLNIPNKGVFFEEPLAKTGASDESQLYGEIGLAYGNEAAHGVLRGIKQAA